MLLVACYLVMILKSAVSQHSAAIATGSTPLKVKPLTFPFVPLFVSSISIWTASSFVLQTSPGMKIKGTVCPKIKKKNILNAVYPSRLFWRELQSFGEMPRRCLPSSRIQWNCMALVTAQRAPKNTYLNSTAMSLSRNYNQVTQDNPQTLLWAV